MGSIRVENSIVIERPVEVVFAYLCDLSNLNMWDPSKTVWQASEGPVGLGATFRIVVDFLGLKLENSLEITAFEANRHFTMTATSGPVPGESSFRVEPDEGHPAHGQRGGRAWVVLQDH